MKICKKFHKEFQKPKENIFAISLYDVTSVKTIGDALAQALAAAV